MDKPVLNTLTVTDLGEMLGLLEAYLGPYGIHGLLVWIWRSGDVMKSILEDTTYSVHLC